MASYLVVDRLSAAQTEQLQALYQGEWWTAGRTREEVRTMLSHSDFVFGVVAPGSTQLVAFARVLTDHIFKALLMDVIVHPEHRGAGLGSFLMGQIVEHPVLSRVQHIELFCRPERVEFYRRLGFTTELGELRHMRKIRERPGPP